MGAAIATTFGAAYAFIALLADPDYSDIVTKMREQIDSVVQRDEQPRLKHKSSLPLIEAAVFELLRYISHIPIMIPHVAMRETQLGGYSIPKGMQIWNNGFNLHHDPRYWDQPWSFRPQRFLDGEGKVIPPDHIKR